jgi:hypothetical protein
VHQEENEPVFVCETLLFHFQNYTTSQGMGNLVMKGESVGVWKESVTACMKVLCCVPGARSWKNHVNPT